MMTLRSPAAPLEIYLLGLVPFDQIQGLQRRLVYELGEGDGGGALILCEHPPTISVGRSGSWGHIRLDSGELSRRGIPVHWVNRGGGCLFHQPGQLAAYFALPLQPRGITLGGYVARLHQAILGVLDEFDLQGALPPGTAGVFLNHARVASVGVAVNRWITYHGLTLNVGPSLHRFDEILDEPGPNGLPLRQTSMEARRQRPAPMAKVRESLIRHLEVVFELRRHHIYTDHPLLRQKARDHVYAASLG